MNISKINFLSIIAITIFMAIMLALTERPAADIALIGGVMAVLNSGVPINIMIDKIIELRKAAKNDN